VTPSAEGPGHPGWRVAAGSLVCLGFGYSAYISYYFGVFLPPLAAEFGWSRGEVALGVSLGNLATVFAAPLLGLAVDRVGPRPAIIASSIAFALAIATLSRLPDSLAVFYGLHVIIALAALGTLPLTYTAMLVSWFDRRRGLALGLALAGVGLGGAAIAPLLSMVINQFGWRTGYLALAALMVIVVIPLAVLLLRPAAHAAVERQRPEPVGHLWRNGVFLRLLVVFASLGLMTLGVSVHLVALLGDAGLSSREAAAGVTVLGLSLVVGRLFGGPLLDHFHAPYVAAAFVALATAGLLLLAAGVNGGALYAAVALIGLGVGAEFDFMSYLISRYLGIASYGRVYGFVYGAFQIGCAIGPVLLGRMFDANGNYAAALLIVAGATATAALILARMPPYPQNLIEGGDNGSEVPVR
jgi:MFS family permease